MKKLLALLLTGAMVFSVAACGGSEAPAEDANAEASTELNIYMWQQYISDELIAAFEEENGSYICNDFGGIKIPYRKTEELIFTNSDYTLRFLEKNFEELKESEHLSEEDKEKFKDMTYDEYVKEVLGVCTAEKGDLCRAVLNILIDDRYTYTEYVYFEMP